MSKQKAKIVGVDHHHLLYPRRKWGKGYAYLLRTYHYCIIPIEKGTLHRNIHGLLQEIPAPSDLNAQMALDQLRILESYGAIHNEDNITRRLKLLIALFDHVEKPTADALRKQLEIVHKFYQKPP